MKRPENPGLEAWLSAYDAFIESTEGKKMGIIAKCEDREFEPVPAGAHPAVCIGMVDLGLQSGPYGTRHQVYIRFEIPGCRTRYEKDGVEQEGPMTIGSYYTVSLSKKSNLRRDLEGWRGRQFTEEEAKGFDITKVLGKPCTVVVQHKVKEDFSKTAVIQSITRAPDGFNPAPENELSLVDDEHRDLSGLPEWLAEQVQSQVPATAGPAPEAAPELDDDLPF